MTIMAEAQGISFNPADAEQGTGLLDDVDVRLVSVRAALWDYNGAMQQPGVFVKAEMVDPESGTAYAPQYWSAGDPKNFVPSTDGKKLIPMGAKKGLNEKTKAMAWLVSLVNSGFPAGEVKDDLSVFDGLVVHVKQEPWKGFSGTAKKVDPATGKPFPDTVLLATAIVQAAPASAKYGLTSGALKGGKKAGTIIPPMLSGSGSVQTATAPAPASAIGDLTEKAVQGMMTILGSKGGSVAKAAVAQEAFKLFAKDPDRNALVQLVYKDEFLAAGPWAFDGTTISMG